MFCRLSSLSYCHSLLFLSYIVIPESQTAFGDSYFLFRFGPVDVIVTVTDTDGLAKFVHQLVELVDGR